MSVSPDPARVLLKFKTFAEQEKLTFAYWEGRSIGERMAATADLVRHAYAQRGIDIDALGPTRSLVRVTRDWSKVHHLRRAAESRIE